MTSNPLLDSVPLASSNPMTNSVPKFGSNPGQSSALTGQRFPEADKAKGDRWLVT